jgi:membrane-bound lytic murein transglycosylase B
MAKQPPEPTKPTSWNIYKAAAKARPLGTVEAATSNEAIQKAAAQFKVPASKLIAVQGR